MEHNHKEEKGEYRENNLLRFCRVVSIPCNLVVITIIVLTTLSDYNISNIIRIIIGILILTITVLATVGYIIDKRTGSPDNPYQSITFITSKKLFVFTMWAVTIVFNTITIILKFFA